jgi:SHAQKYF class myb-like DNA-binding protein
MPIARFSLPVAHCMLHCTGQLPTSKMNKGKWTQDTHKAFLTGWEKYGYNWNLVAKVVSTRTAMQIKKHAQSLF